MKARYPRCITPFYKMKIWWRKKKAEYRRNKDNDKLCAKLTKTI